MARSNYGQVKRQKEAARKARQQKKLERRQTRDSAAAPELDNATGEGTVTPSIPDGDMPP